MGGAHPVEADQGDIAGHIELETVAQFIEAAQGHHIVGADDGVGHGAALLENRVHGATTGIVAVIAAHPGQVTDTQLVQALDRALRALHADHRVRRPAEQRIGSMAAGFGQQVDQHALALHLVAAHGTDRHVAIGAVVKHQRHIALVK